MGYPVLRDHKSLGGSARVPFDASCWRTTRSGRSRGSLGSPLMRCPSRLLGPD